VYLLATERDGMTNSLFSWGRLMKGTLQLVAP
jgi:hypothetical protein